MLFLSESVQASRRDLIRRMEAGELSKEETSRQMLELLADDAFACYVGGVALLDREEPAGARELFWRAMELHPAHSMGYVGVSHALERTGEDPDLARSIMPLALRRMLHDPGQAGLVEEKWLARMREKLGPEVDRDLSLAAVDALSLTTKDEPERITRLLEPWRLVQEVIDRPERGIAKATVDAILEQGAACAPLLVGILRGWARSESENYASAEAALALLGETGEAGALPAVLEFTATEDEGMAEAAAWAAKRLAERHPEVAEDAEDLEPVEAGLSVYDFCCYDMGEDDEDEYDEDEEEAGTPVRALPKPGRNDPCWCGSGKKYKKCHLEEDEQGERETGTMADRLLELTSDWISRSEMHAALEAFTGEPDAELDEDTQIAFFDWLLHDYVHPRLHRTVPQEYARRHGAASEIKSWLDPRFSLFEIQRTEPGKGLEVKDLLQDGTLFLHDVSTSNSASAGQWILARVQDEDGQTIPTGTSLSVPEGYRDAFRAWVVDEHARSGQDWPAWLRSASHRLRLKCLQMGVDFRETLTQPGPQ